MRYVYHVVSVTVAIALLVCLWLKAPSVLNSVFDFNIAMIKFLTGSIPYGAHIEGALRGMGADRALVFIESTVVVKTAFHCLKRLKRFFGKRR